jgi:hypothetical protein
MPVLTESGAKHLACRDADLYGTGFARRDRWGQWHHIPFDEMFVASGAKLSPAQPAASPLAASPSLSDIRQALGIALDNAFLTDDRTTTNEILAALHKLGFAIPEDQAEVQANG